MPSFGLVGSSASIDDIVEVVTFGTLTNINTSSFSEGDILFVSSNGTAGNTLTATKEGGESVLCQNIGKVIRSHATVGSIKVGGAGRANATPNLNDGNIFIGNGSNQSSTASLNTKIQDYLNTGVNLPSPTFTGDIDFSDATTPSLSITDSTNPTTTIIRSQDGLGQVGTTTSHNFGILSHNSSRLTFASTLVNINPNGDDYDVQIKDSSNASLFRTDALNSRVGILDSSPSYTLDVNGTGRFTGAVQLDDNLTVTGDLQVNGTTTTVNQTNLDVSDNIIGLNRGASSNANDSGIIIERGSTGDNAAIIFDESADKFTVGTTTSTPSATGNITVTTGTMVANVEGNVTGNVTGDVTGNADTATALATARNFSLTGDVTAGAVSFDGSGNVALSTTIAANSVALGTDTTGNYMSDLTEGTGIDISHTPGEGSNGTITLDLTEVGFGGGANRLITDDGDGTVTAESNLTFDGSHLSIASTGRIYLDGGGDTFWYEAVANVPVLVTGGTERFRVNNVGNVQFNVPQADANFRISTTSEVNTFFVDGSADRVGIGTNSPDYKLDVSGDVRATGNLVTNGEVRLDNGGDSIAFMGVSDANYRRAFYANNDDHYITNRHTGGDLILMSNNGSAAGETERLRFVAGSGTQNAYFSNVNVGIGTSSPTEKLQINSNTTYDTKIRLGDNGTSRYFLAGMFDSNTGMIGYVNGTPSHLAFHTGTGATGSEKMRIETGGNVGIGTNSPGEKLEVSGNIKTTAHLVLPYGEINDAGTDLNIVGTNGLTLQSSAGTALTIPNASTNVGIGTSTLGAGAKLNVVSGSSAYTAQFSRHDADDGLFLHSEAEATHYNWLISTQDNVDRGFEITPSTGVGNRTFSTPAFVIKADTGNVGIGTSSPSHEMVLRKDQAAETELSIVNLTSNASATTNLRFRNATSGSETGNGVLLQLTNGNDFKILNQFGNNLIIGTSNTERLRIDAQGNLRFADNGTNPTAVINTAFLFNDGGELKVLDELGNTTTISPHNFSLIPDGASEERAWGYYSEKDIVDDEGNVTATQKVNVDMMKLARLVEQLTGEKLVYTEED